MHREKQTHHVIETLVSIVLIAVAGVGVWALLNWRENNLTGGSGLAQVTLTMTSSQAPQATSQVATQNAVSTIAILKQQDATARVIELTSSPYPTPVPGPGGISNIEEPTRVLLAGLGLGVENGWGGYINGMPVSVYMGTLVVDPNQGGILVMWTSSPISGRRLFAVPGRHGSLRIVAANNNRLTLTSADNATFYFDVPGLRLASSLTEAVPTVDFSLMITPLAPGPLVATPVPTAYP